MGSAQSKIPAPAIEEKLAERIRAMRLQATVDAGIEADREYVLVGDAPPTYTPYSKEISISTAEQWEKKLMQDPKNRLALSALSQNDAGKILIQPSTLVTTSHIFNTVLPLEGAPITNQRSSGRCWLFASTNVFRVALMKKHSLSSFELSQSYLFYWDKLEKANFFLEQILSTADVPLDDRLLQTLLASPVGDGGQWDMVANLVGKYGLVPQALYPDAFNASSSASMDRLLTTKLREDALKLRDLAASKSSHGAVGAAKEAMLREIHLILTLMLGPPPSPSKAFTWEYYDSDAKFHSLTTTPLAFAGALSTPPNTRVNGGSDPHKLFSLVNDPRNEYYSLLTVARLGNIHGGRGVTYVNVPMAVIKRACVGMLRAGIPVFFGCDVGKFSSPSSGIMDPALIDYELAFNVTLGMTKAQRLLVGESAMTHAMVLTGVHVEEGESVRWRVMNSWGEGVGDKGFFVASDKWMDEWTYQAVVDPRFVDKKVRDVLGKEAKVLPLWDPMGALAR